MSATTTLIQSAGRQYHESRIECARCPVTFVQEYPADYNGAKTLDTERIAKQQGWLVGMSENLCPVCKVDPMPRGAIIKAARESGHRIVDPEQN